MSTFIKKVPKSVLTGSFIVNGHEIMAFLADSGEDSGIYVADDLLETFGHGDERRGPNAYKQANIAYLEELARVSECKVSELIGLRKDGRYWCVHQVAVNYVRWLDVKAAVLFDRAAIEWAKTKKMARNEWIEKRGEATNHVKLYSNMIKTQLTTPKGFDDGYKYASMNKAVQAPFNKALGGPSDTGQFKEENGVNAAMDIYPTPMLDGVNLARSVIVANVTRKGIKNLPDAKNEVARVANPIADVIKKLLSSP